MVQLLLDLGADVDERVMLEELEEPTLSWGAAVVCGAGAITRLRACCSIAAPIPMPMSTLRAGR